MTNVFLGGSRKISHLNPKIRQRIDNVLSKGFAVLIGDAMGRQGRQEYLAKGVSERHGVLFREGMPR